MVRSPPECNGIASIRPNRTDLYQEGSGSSYERGLIHLNGLVRISPGDAWIPQQS
ncbi:MAG: hypothetical protein H0V70_30485 [Ktedonobacteraceae bacterium]|nr:hypothetical protein [Ktedonobacteraceae bacterium]